jgi:glycosyltransferase involved in cell wall biosynthesis
LGRVHKIKGVDILVKAFANVVDKVNDVKLVVVGPDEGFLSELQALVKSLKIESKVVILGPLYGRDKLEAYVDSEACVLPSRYEAFPMTVLEACVCSKPVIVSRVGGIEDLVVNGETGLVFEPENIGQLASNIIHILTKADKAEEMGLSGRAFVKNRFAIEIVVAKLEAIYRESLVYKKGLAVSVESLNG